MLKLKLTPIVLALSVAATAAATVVYADNQKQQNEQAALDGAKIGLIGAIEHAEAQAKGRALEAELERKDGAYVYEIEVVGAAGVTELRMDPATGKVLSSGPEKAQDIDEDEARERAGLANTRINLAQAVTAAEQHLQGGKAKAAGLEAEDSKLMYEVEVLKGGKAFEVNVDPASGKVLAFDQDDEDA